MRHFLGLFAVLSGIVGVGCSGAGAGGGEGAGEVALSRAALTTADVDLAPECEGIITYANVASFAMLDEVLPSDLALNVIGARSAAPFTTLKSLSDVTGMGPARLKQVEGAARSNEFIDGECAGIFEELALSADDAAAMVGYLNVVTEPELDGVLHFLINPMAKDSLLAARPFAVVDQIAATAGVAEVTFRALRNAATNRGPFEELASAVNALNRDVVVLRHFDWVDVVTSDTGRLSGMTCFGVDESLLVNGATVRPELADGDEVLGNVSGAVSFADRFHELTIDPAVGLADLEGRVEGGTFFGCYLSYTPDPWSGINRNFFVNTETGFGVLTETRWSELAPR